eukprot:933799_1
MMCIRLILTKHAKVCLVAMLLLIYAVNGERITAAVNGSTGIVENASGAVTEDDTAGGVELFRRNQKYISDIPTAGDEIKSFKSEKEELFVGAQLGEDAKNRSLKVLSRKRRGSWDNYCTEKNWRDPGQTCKEDCREWCLDACVTVCALYAEELYDDGTLQKTLDMNYDCHRQTRLGRRIGGKGDPHVQKNIGRCPGLRNPAERKREREAHDAAGRQHGTYRKKKCCDTNFFAFFIILFTCSRWSYEC